MKEIKTINIFSKTNLFKDDRYIYIYLNTGNLLKVSV